MWVSVSISFTQSQSHKAIFLRAVVCKRVASGYYHTNYTRNRRPVQQKATTDAQSRDTIHAKGSGRPHDTTAVKGRRTTRRPRNQPAVWYAGCNTVQRVETHEMRPTQIHTLYEEDERKEKKRSCGHQPAYVYYIFMNILRRLRAYARSRVGFDSAVARPLPPPRHAIEDANATRENVFECRRRHRPHRIWYNS